MAILIYAFQNPMNFAVNYNVPLMCRYVDEPTPINECYYKIANATKNSDVCKKINSTAYPTIWDDCFFNIGTHRTDRDTCSYIIRVPYRDSCYDIIANITNDSDDCELIEDKIIIDNCYFRIANAVNDEQICKLINYHFVQKSLCYSTVAVNKGDYTICALDESSECVANYAKATGDTSVCNGVIEANEKARCFSNVATERNNPDVCNNEPNCLSNFAIAHNDETLCPKNSFYSVSCYMIIANKKNDTKICDLITPELDRYTDQKDDKSNCYNLVKNG